MDKELYKGREGQTTTFQRRCEAESHGGWWSKSVQSSAGVDESGYGCSRFPVTVGEPMTYSGWASLCAGSSCGFSQVTSILPV